MQMPPYDEFIRKLPPDVQDTVRYIWDSLPVSDRSSLQLLLNGFPTQANLIRLLLNLSTVHFKLAFGQKNRVAIVGPANVGKSTLYNQFVQNKGDLAVVSPIPGTTRVNQQSDIGLFNVIDTPGADATGVLGQNEKAQALSAADQADFLVIVFDAIQGIKRTEAEIFEELTSLGKPHIVVLNKIDLVRRETPKVIEHVAASLGLKPDQIVPIAAKDGKNLDQVLLAIAVAEPQIVAAMGRAMPEYRWKMAWRTIVSAASVSAVVALTPLPVIDFLPLVFTQSVMVLGIARIFKYEITLDRARDLVIAFGIGFLGRTIFQELSKLGGVPGWLLSSAIATSTTIAMGYAAVQWFEHGRKLPNEELKRITEGFTRYLVNSFKGFGKGKPDKKSLQEHVTEALGDAPMVPPPIPGDQDLNAARAAPST
jgi:small GTP-binding protein